MSSIITINNEPVNIDGNLPKVGSVAPDFKLIDKDLNTVNLSNYNGKRKVLNIFPSVDTQVCSLSVIRFNKDASRLKNTVVLCISQDLPFAQSRFISNQNLENVIMLSTFRYPSFKKDYGVDILDGPLAGLCARAVIVLDENNKVLYSQLVSEITHEPDYAVVLAVIS